jgi:hypothetical protein
VLALRSPQDCCGAMIDGSGKTSKGFAALATRSEPEMHLLPTRPTMQLHRGAFRGAGRSTTQIAYPTLAQDVTVLSHRVGLRRKNTVVRRRVIWCGFSQASGNMSANQVPNPTIHELIAMTGSTSPLKHRFVVSSPIRRNPTASLPGLVSTAVAMRQRFVP